MMADEAMHRPKGVIRRQLLALAAERGYCGYFKKLTSHLPSEQKPERFLMALAGKDAAVSGQNQAFYGIVFLRSSIGGVRRAFGKG